MSGEDMNTVEVVDEEVTALVLLEKANPVELYTNGIDRVLKQIEHEARSHKADPSTAKGRQEIASVAHKVARAKVILDEMGKKLGEDARKRIESINADRRKVRDTLDELKEDVRKPLTDFEAAEAKRIATHEANIREIELAGDHVRSNWKTLSIEAMRDRLNEIQNEQESDWQEFKIRAESVIARAAECHRVAIASREEYDREQAELIRLRAEAEERARVEREAKIAAEAAEKARLEAEKKAQREARSAAAKAEEERQRIEAQRLESERAATRERERAERAERERVEAERIAEERAKAQAARAAAEAKAAAERAEVAKAEAVRRERERIEAEQRKEQEAVAAREADRKHRSRINNEVVASLVALKVPQDQGKLIVEAIAKGVVQHVRITY